MLQTLAKHEKCQNKNGSSSNYISQIITSSFTQFKALIKGQGFIKESEVALQAWNQINISELSAF
jgi:hypothetical protein